MYISFASGNYVIKNTYYDRMCCRYMVNHMLADSEKARWWKASFYVVNRFKV